MLHIFLDTNILEEDPFMQRIWNLRLLVKYGKAEILIPDVVIDELTKHTLKKSKESIKNLEQTINTLKSFQIQNIPSIQVVSLTINEIRTKYNDLQTSGLMKILSSDNIKIHRIMERYISEKKPFAENKDSFRDYTLFCTCADYVSDNNLSNCYFISKNTKDFANKENTDFHADLKAESRGMKYVIGLREFIAIPIIQNLINEVKALDQYEKCVENWIQNNIPSFAPRNGGLITAWAIQNLNNTKYLETLFNGKLYNTIENEVIDKCLNATPEEFSSFFDSGYVDFEGIDSIEEINIIDFTVSDDESATISGILKLQVEVSIYANNWCYDRDDEDDSRFICLESGYVGMEYSFDVTIKKDGSFDTYFDCQKIDSDLGDNYNE